MQVATQRGVDPELPLASTSTLHRLENRIDRKSLVDINKLFVEAFIASFKGKEPPKELILDFDATDDPIHGQQGTAVLSWLLQRVLLPAAVCVLRGPVAH